MSSGLGFVCLPYVPKVLLRVLWMCLISWTAYTTFNHSNLDITFTSGSDKDALGPYATGSIIPGGPSDLFGQILTISADITNTGSVAGAEVAQLYLSFPEAAKAPVRQLRGFQKVYLEPGETQTVTFPIQRRDLSIWDSEKQGWAIEGGSFTAWLGRSSRDFTGKADFDVFTA